MPKVDNRWIGYKNKKSGEFGEQLVEAALVRRGFEMVEKVNTPWVPVRRGGRIVSAFVTKKVSGDFRAIETPSGRSVLVEVKTKDSKTLPFSAFEPHQIYALDKNHRCGGISLIAWVREGQIIIIPWPRPGFYAGQSIKFSPEMAT